MVSDSEKKNVSNFDIQKVTIIKNFINQTKFIVLLS